MLVGNCTVACAYSSPSPSPSPNPSPLFPALKYSSFIEERRYLPRAVMDDSDRQQPRNLSLLPAVELCEHVYFHVLVGTPAPRATPAAPLSLTQDAIWPEARVEGLRSLTGSQRD